jgi:hypothetical protein
MKAFIGRRVQIIAQGKVGAGYFKTGQYAYILGATSDGGVYCIDKNGPGSSPKGQLCFLISKTRDMRGGALWISSDAVRFTKKR